MMWPDNPVLVPITSVPLVTLWHGPNIAVPRHRLSRTGRQWQG